MTAAPRDPAEAVFLSLWPKDGQPEEAEHAEQVVAAFDAYLREHGLEPEGAAFHRWRQARALKALIDLRRPTVNVTYLATGGVVVDDGSSVAWFPNAREAACELSARGIELPAPKPEAPIPAVLPDRNRGRWAAGVRLPVRTPSPSTSRTEAVR